ncbi:MAG: flagellin, partial [Planctomycetaceae bacterium]|nr:flagellin [Planctomycetaceae bacterium]
MTGLYVASQSQSLTAQHQLQRNMGDLSNVLLRLSTGLRINSGKDDPAGLISSELLKSDITATGKAITNAQRANSVISIADSSLGQVSSLLNDIKGLIVEAANTGAMTADQIRANQLQIDASLDSIDRIAKTTNYQGQLLLDGSMDFQTQGLSNAAVRDLKVHQANFGTLDKIDIGINVQKSSDYAKLFYDKGGISSEVVIEIGGNLGSDVFRFQAGSSVTDIAQAVNKVSDSTGVRAVVGADATNGQIMITSAGFDNDINLRALTAGAAAGNYTVKFTAGNSSETTYKITEPSAGQPGIIDFRLKMQPKTAPSHSALDESFNGLYTYDITGDLAGGGIVVQTSGIVIRGTEFVEYTGSIAGKPPVSATFDSASGKLQIHYNAAATAADLERAINSIKGFKLLQGDETDLITGTVAPADLRANNALDFAATVTGTRFENTDIVYFKGTDTGNDVDLEYKAYAQQAAATIRWGGAVPAAGDVQLRISGKEAGSSLNGVTIEFEQDDTFDPGDVSAVYDAERKILHIRGQVDNIDPTKNASFGTLKAAIEKASPFRADITEYNTATSKFDIAHELSKKIDGGLVTGTGLAAGYTTTLNLADNSYIKTGEVYGDIGTDHQALFIRVLDDTITANDVVKAFNDTANSAIAANFSVRPSLDNDGTGTIFSAAWDIGVNVRVFSGALTGGNDGYISNVTARELVEFINSDAVLSKMFHADVALGQFGSGF